jgi:asparagine synthetase B (glutamine-hydrolysing)
MIYDKKIVSTFAKHMICPDSLYGVLSQQELGDIGSADFSDYPYRHNSDRFRGDSVASSDMLLAKLKGAVLASVPTGKKPLLLLSDGKDSMGLAVAFSEVGVSCDTLTLLRADDLDLRSYVEATAKKLGHSSYFVDVDEIVSSFDKDVFSLACKKMSVPVLDQGFLFFLFGLRCFFDRNKLNPTDFVVVDGLGNDEYFGYIPSHNQLNSYKLSKFRLWSLVPKSLQQLRWYLRSPAESQGDLSSLFCFFPLSHAHDLNKYFSLVPHSSQAESFVDFRAFSRGAFHDHQCMMGKTKVAADFLGSQVVFPWLNSALVDYCFNLPISEKYDFSLLKNKLLLRDLLNEKTGWEQSKRGVDLYFDLNFRYFRESILVELVPYKFIESIDKKIGVPDYVKKRGYLELLNFYVYLSAKGFSTQEIHEVFFGK